MDSFNYSRVLKKLEEANKTLAECEAIICVNAEDGDITKTLKIKELRQIIEIWISTMIVNY